MEFIQNELKEIKELLIKQGIQQKEFLTLDEATSYLSQSKSSLYKLTSKKEIPYYVPGGKLIYFRRIELDDWIISSRVSTVNDIESSIDNYLSQPLNHKV